jgi:hypothetical protein
MVAVISTNRSLSKSFYYNEQKVKTGQANCILAENYPCEPDELSARERLAVLRKRASLNENLSKNCVHISLNFHPSDQLSKALLQEIARKYMAQIGFGRQPFLVYQHWDAGHPHLHVLAVNIRPDGSWINTYRMGIGVSQKASRQIEKTYQLTVAGGPSPVLSLAAGTQKLRYGKTPTAPAMAGVLATVLPSFHYGSLIELNAVLRHYNVCADPASGNASSSQHQGLVYRALSEDGRKIGTPLKASSFSTRPTLRYLSARFISGKAQRTAHQQRVISSIDLALFRSGRSMAGLQDDLAQEGIKTVFAISPAGIVSELFFVDFKTRCVFRASELGEKYTPFRLMEKFPTIQPVPRQHQHIAPESAVLASKNSLQKDANGRKGSEPGASGINSEHGEVKLLLFAPIPEGDYLPWELKRRPKKKRKEISIQL